MSVLHVEGDRFHRDVYLYEHSYAVRWRDLREQNISFDVGDVVGMRRIGVDPHFDVLALRVLQKEARTKTDFVVLRVRSNNSVEAKEDEVLVFSPLPFG